MDVSELVSVVVIVDDPVVVLDDVTVVDAELQQANPGRWRHRSSHMDMVYHVAKTAPACASRQCACVGPCIE